MLTCLRQPQRLPAQHLDARKTLRHRQEPKARRRTAALMQPSQKLFGRLGKQLGPFSKGLNPPSKHQNQLVQALPTQGRRHLLEPRRVDRS